MNVKQLSVFIENKAGRVSEVTDTLGKAGVSIRGFSVSDTADYGIIRLVLDDPDRGREVLHDAGFAVKVSEVLCIDLPDVPGGLASVLKVVSDAGVNIEYVYSLIDTYVVINVADIGRAVALLQDKPVVLVSQEVDRAGLNRRASAGEQGGTTMRGRILRLAMGVLEAAMAAALAVTLVGCSAGTSGTGTTGAADAEPIKIGAIVSLTGTYAGLGDPEKKTIEMEVKRINEAGGINGRPVEVIFEDDGTDEAKAVAAASKLIEQDNVVAIIGATGTGQSMAVRSEIDRAGIPQVSMAGGSAITAKLDPLVFQTPWSNTLVVPYTMEYLKKQGITKIGLITDSGGFGKDGKAVVDGRGTQVRDHHRLRSDLQPRRCRHDRPAHQHQELGRSGGCHVDVGQGGRHRRQERQGARADDPGLRQPRQCAPGVHRWRRCLG